ncbi:multicopper oxidase family protein [Lyngbya sp. CCY1209]|jgi:FtsP/CotA-like multicopper oxidase with cupredoxin domain|uniref:multicopper oxidase family protein n=1 Tax=Lyngbya sp. CCY1209 TaxID=2886103 RepID=UPI002D214D7C|nr:multicopper oxidase family protein [Lyngbya sp. CCY1209]MEB3884706.1 multicopper oxidase family protein [Lyngbya sp. CCY1209]
MYHCQHCEKTMVKLDRRKFLALGVASLGTALAAHGLFRSSRDSTDAKSAIASTPLYRSSGGLLEFNLDARYHSVNVGGRSAQLMTYNGQIPGPRLEVRPGDTVRIHFSNRLPQPTNIHYHGLHIPITGNADNVFLHIPPGENLTYEFTLNSDHPAGLFWYHPHLHGRVAEQLFGGLAGLFVVRGELDEIPEIKAASEQFLVLQDFALDQQGKLLPEQSLSIMTGREGDLMTVNGKNTPDFLIPPDQLLRLRILNASPSRFYRLSLENHPFHLIATDGGSLAEPVELPELLLAPGERAEVLIRGDQEPGRYRLLNLPYQRVGMGMMGGGMMGNAPANDAPQVLATVSYDAKSSMPLPAQLIPIQPLPEPQQVRRFQMNHGMIRGQGMAFLFNGQSYEPGRIDTQVQLDTVEDWEIINTGMMDHPFHVHGNAFQVVSRNGKPEPFRAWKDVVSVKPGETAKIRMAFRDFAGKTVYHCHILDHEDLGMMGNLEIRA